MGIDGNGERFGHEPGITAAVIRAERDEPVVTEGGKESMNHSRTSNEEAAPDVLFVKIAATQFESRVTTDRLPLLQQYRTDEEMWTIARRTTRA